MSDQESVQACQAHYEGLPQGFIVMHACKEGCAPFHAT